MRTEMQRRPTQIEHVRIICARSFEEVLLALKASTPPLDPELAEDLRAARTEAIAERRSHGPNLWLFHTRDHGALIAAEGRSEKALQLDIGNPLTAESMTRHQLGAALYAPLRVLLYEDPDGQAIFEYDLPSSFFSQFGDPRVTAVGRDLDTELEAILLAAAG
jgi:hypothetical protein